MLKLLLKSFTSLAIIGFTACAASASDLTLTGTLRDFLDTHPDFEKEITGLDLGIVQPTLGVDNKPVYAGLAGNPSTHGQAAFDQWYRDVAGVNLSKPYAITLADPDNDGIFSYTNNAFFPIDGELFGNQGRSHNYHFTYEIHSQFTYQGGETFSFTGDDDLWVFINNQLAIDLGGVHGAANQSVNLDAVAATLGITVGNTYNFDLFFAERHTTASNFQIETSLALRPVPEPLTLLGTGTALGFGAFFKRKLSSK